MKRRLGAELVAVGNVDDGGGWDLVGRSMVICSECPTKLVLFQRNRDGAVAVVCDICRSAYAPSQYSRATEQSLLGEVARLRRDEQVARQKQLRRQRAAEQARSRPPRSKTCRECGKTKDPAQFPSWGNLCYRCGGTDYRPWERPAGAPGLGKRR